MTITTTDTATSTGAPRILATGGGKQATFTPDADRSASWNHGTAAGVLAARLGLSEAHSYEYDGKHRFMVA